MMKHFCDFCDNEVEKIHNVIDIVIAFTRVEKDNEHNDVCQKCQNKISKNINSTIKRIIKRRIENDK